MKKKLAIVVALALVVCAVCLSACVDPSLKEVKGTYEMTEISGNMNGTQITKDMYEYFRIILDGKGKATVESKGSGVGAISYSASGTYTYKDGKINVTTRSGSQKVTETYDYEDGVITYTVSQQGMSLSVKFERVNND